MPRGVGACPKGGPHKLIFLRQEGKVMIWLCTKCNEEFEDVPGKKKRG